MHCHRLNYLVVNKEEKTNQFTSPRFSLKIVSFSSPTQCRCIDNAPSAVLKITIQLSVKVFERKQPLKLNRCVRCCTKLISLRVMGVEQIIHIQPISVMGFVRTLLDLYSFFIHLIILIWLIHLNTRFKCLLLLPI